MPVMWQKEIVLHSPFIVGGSGHHTGKVLFQKPPTTIKGFFRFLKMRWEELKHGDKIEAFWHFNSLSFDFFWKQGTVNCLISGHKKFIPDDGIGSHMLFPHRMDEVRSIGDTKITIHEPELPGVIIVDQVNP